MSDTIFIRQFLLTISKEYFKMKTQAINHGVQTCGRFCIIFGIEI